MTKTTIPTSSFKGSSILLHIFVVPCKFSYPVPERCRLHALLQAVLLAHGPDQPAGRPSWMHLLVLCHCRSCFDLGSLHLLLATALRRSFLPWSRYRTQICHRPYLHCRMFPCPHSRCIGHAMAGVDCVWDRTWGYHFRRVWRYRRRHCLEANARKYCRRSRHSLCYDLFQSRVPPLGKPIRRLP